jgi:hypothetical protein
LLPGLAGRLTLIANLGNTVSKILLSFSGGKCVVSSRTVLANSWSPPPTQPDMRTGSARSAGTEHSCLSMSLLRRPDDHHRGLWARLPTEASAIGTHLQLQFRHLMTRTAASPRCRAERIFHRSPIDRANIQQPTYCRRPVAPFAASFKPGFDPRFNVPAIARAAIDHRHPSRARSRIPFAVVESP